MYLYLVAQALKFVVNATLLRPKFFSRALELHEQRAPARQPKDSIWVAGVARHAELGAFDPEMLPHQVDGPLLDLSLRGPHA